MTEYLSIPLKSLIFIKYITNLVDRVYKILPLYEEKNEGLYNYVQSMIYELNGVYWTIDEVKSNPDYLVVLAILESLSDDIFSNEFDRHSVIKREVFRCIETIKKIKATVESGE